MITHALPNLQDLDAAPAARVRELRPLAERLVARVAEVVPRLEVESSAPAAERVSIAVALAAQALDEPEELRELARRWAPALHRVGLRPVHVHGAAREIAGLVAALATEPSAADDARRWSRAASIMAEELVHEADAAVPVVRLARSPRPLYRNEATRRLLREHAAAFRALFPTVACDRQLRDGFDVDPPASFDAADEAPAPASDTPAIAPVGAAASARTFVDGDAIARAFADLEEIALRTDLLGLSAATEAARVGTSGRAFEVIADELRRLARRNAGAVRALQDRIDDRRRRP